MSGICGLFNLDGAPVAEPDLRAMSAMLEQRGPERTGRWQDGAIGLGHTLLATTPELQFEQQPLEHAETGCTITADVRLDNREELASALDIRRPLESVGDAQLILAAYLQWGQECPNRLLGDFAFAIWDPRDRRLFCARDHFGMRPLYYHHGAGKRFVFASDARAILVLSQVPYRINEGRVADFLVPQLEWYDYTSTFFEGVYRLPPGNRLTVTPSSFEVAEYWHPHPGPELGNLSDDEYREGFVEVFTRAIDARLRAPEGTIGSMLSGGMDSGSVTAIAKEILRERGNGPLATFSGARRLETAARDNVDCPETRAILASSSMSAIAPHLVYPDALEDIFEPLSSGFEEPFDGVFTILKALFLRAHDNGLRVLLDGAGGDVILHEGSYIVRLFRRGKFKLALHEMRGENAYWGGISFASSLSRYARNAFVSDLFRRPLRTLRSRARLRQWVKDSLIAPDFARSMDIPERYRTMRRFFPGGWTPDYAEESCNRIWPSMTAGRERYARIAAAAGMEARDPFMDTRVLEFCSRLPGHLRLRDGWPKAILRDVMAGALPDEVRWTRRKPHLGWWFTEAVTQLAVSRGELDLAALDAGLKRYVDSAALADAWQDFRAGDESEPIQYAYVLLAWLQQAAERPVVPD